MRRAAKIDRNHGEIVKALRAIGCTVQSLAAVGKGCPDLLVGARGINYLMEIKDGNKPPSSRRLTSDELHWLKEWAGSCLVVNNITEALAVVGAQIQ